MAVTRGEEPTRTPAGAGEHGACDGSRACSQDKCCPGEPRNRRRGGAAVWLLKLKPKVKKRHLGFPGARAPCPGAVAGERTLPRQKVLVDPGCQTPRPASQLQPSRHRG